MRFVATTLFGLERLAGEDIDFIGGNRISTGDGRIIFEAPPEKAADACICFRYAERVLLEVGHFRASTFDELFEGTKALPWGDFIGSSDAFPVKGHSIKSKLFSIPDCQKIVKKAVVNSLMQSHGVNTLPETGIKYQIVFFILNDEASLMIDLCGEPLHKRGYRKLHNISPMRETLSAAMVSLSRPRENVCIIDPMCGSGTIPIECALMVKGMAVGVHREFDAEKFPFIPREAWQNARKAAAVRVMPAPMKIYGYDNDPECIRIARENAVNAGVADDIVFEVRDIRDFKLPYDDARITVVTDPPYGKRMGDIESARETASQFGNALSAAAPRAQIYVMSTDEEYARCFGRRADKVRAMHNGTEKCFFYQFFKANK